MMMELKEGSLVYIDFGKEYDAVKEEGSIGALYQGMKGKIVDITYTCTVVLSQESQKKVNEYNAAYHQCWRTNPRIPIRFLFPLKSIVLKNE